MHRAAGTTLVAPRLLTAPEPQRVAARPRRSASLGRDRRRRVHWATRRNGKTNLQRRVNQGKECDMGLIKPTFNSLEDLFWDQIKDIYDAEQRLTEALPKM